MGTPNPRSAKEIHMAAKTLQEALAEITASAKLQRKAVIQFYRAFPDIPRIVDEIQESPESDDFRQSAWFGTIYGGSLHINLSRLEGFKGDNLINLLFRLETQFNVEFEMQDFPAQSRKVFTAHKRWAYGILDITVSAELKPQASECRRVQVGVTKQVVETPIYELQCNEVEA
jgi:hypothetical protein